ncbi:hypothetical protein D7Z54_13235 [Salibacterium salarium]|uniref:Sporulation protein YtxC n=1 Tax=Salibacterium salarium TaxID=284579 RepID=A0A428N3J2_9BACI|nr:sporulation protein YtxC [Salibacterium salarium]RSL32981.1 hypothetical protein D7Z54_13235 [Salibacterium salarium]
MFSIDFECEADSAVVYQIFTQDKREWEQKGINTGDIYKHNAKIEWDFCGDEQQWRESLVPYLAASLCDYMVEEKELQWVQGYIERTFLYEEEAPAITDIANSLLDGERVDVPETSLLQKRKHFVYREMTEEMKHNKEIQWTPMLTFRLGTYHHLLVKAASAAIDEYKWEQEYQTMIEGCRHYIKHMKPMCAELHVLLEEEPVFLDENKQVIDEWTRLHHLEPTLVFEKQLPFEYMVVSPAVSFAPEQLFIYSDTENGTVQTFQMIFQEKVQTFSKKQWPLKQRKA